MISTVQPLIRVLVLASATLLTSGHPAAQAGVDVCNLQTAERIVAIGDIHGSLDNLTAILRATGLIDNRQRWAGGKAVFVQTGDVLDRGPASRAAIDLLRKLESEAPKAGGLVLPLLGNHEVMRLARDWRYVSEGEYNAFKGPGSPELRDRAFEFISADNVKRAKAANQPFDAREFRKVFYDTNPLGAIEMQLAFAPDADYGKWVRDRNVMARINGIAFLHGGLAPDIAAKGCAAINAGAREEMRKPLPPAKADDMMITSSTGPLWYRGMVDDGDLPGPADAEKVDAALKAIGARAVVLGHTVAPTFRIRTGSGGRVVQIDTGMLNGTYYPGGRPSALEIVGDTWTAIYLDRRELISKTPALRPPTPPAR